MPPTSSISRLFRPSICPTCRRHSLKKAHNAAALSTTVRLAADPKAPAPPPAPPAAENVFSDLRTMANKVSRSSQGRAWGKQKTAGLLENIVAVQGRVDGETPDRAASLADLREEPHHMHIYSHKHNTHITLTRPNREPVISLSCGNIGFRKGQRGSFDAAFQLAAYVMRMMQDRGLLATSRKSGWDEKGDMFGRRLEAPINKLEVVLRGFGKGRDAVVRALLGAEGRLLRTRITTVSDDTKLKFGGTKSQNPRRLG